MSRSLVEFCSVTSLCEGWQRSGTQHLRRVDKYDGPILRRLWIKVHEILGQLRGAPAVFKAIPGCLCHVSVLRYSPLGLKVVEKTNFWPKFLGGTTPSFLLQIVSAI